MKKAIGGIAALLGLAVILLLAGHDAGAQDKKGKDKDKKPAATSAVFEVYKDKGGKHYRFRLKDSEGHILAIASKGYSEKDDILKVINSIKGHALKAKIEDHDK